MRRDRQGGRNRCRNARHCPPGTTGQGVPGTTGRVCQTPSFWSRSGDGTRRPDALQQAGRGGLGDATIGGGRRRRGASWGQGGGDGISRNGDPDRRIDEGAGPPSIALQVGGKNKYVFCGQDHSHSARREY